VLEGCHGLEGLRDGIRLAFLRKGSADLIGKALRIPDELSPAVEVIVSGILEDRTVTADVVEVDGRSPEGTPWRRHLVAFGGVGIFGDIPRFTENRLVKYYKGFLGSLFGDRGPFVVGAALAVLKRGLDRPLGSVPRIRLRHDGRDVPPRRYMSVIVMNGDLGRDCPMAQGVPFGGGYLRVLAARDGGLLMSVRQIRSLWRGDIEERAEDLCTRIFDVERTLSMFPRSQRPYWVNVDGLLECACGETLWRVAGRVQLIAGR